MSADTDKHLHPAMQQTAVRAARSDYPLPQFRNKGDGTPEGIAQTAYERGAVFGHAFPRLADERLAAVWDSLDEALPGEEAGTMTVPVADLLVLRDALRSVFVRPGQDAAAQALHERERMKHAGMPRLDSDEES